MKHIDFASLVKLHALLIRHFNGCTVAYVV